MWTNAQKLLPAEVALWEVAPLFKDLLAGTFIQFHKDRVNAVLPRDGKRSFDSNRGLQAKDIGGSVLLESGMKIDYDWYANLLVINAFYRCLTMLSEESFLSWFLCSLMGSILRWHSFIVWIHLLECCNGIFLPERI